MTKLPFKVEVKSTYLFYKTIAAFDVECAAVAYARDCAQTNPAFLYRVTKRGKVVDGPSMLRANQSTRRSQNDR